MFPSSDRIFGQCLSRGKRLEHRNKLSVSGQADTQIEEVRRTERTGFQQSAIGAQRQRGGYRLSSCVPSSECACGYRSVS